MQQGTTHKQSAVQQGTAHADARGARRDPDRALTGPLVKRTARPKGRRHRCLNSGPGADAYPLHAPRAGSAGARQATRALAAAASASTGCTARSVQDRGQSAARSSAAPWRVAGLPSGAVHRQAAAADAARAAAGRSRHCDRAVGGGWLRAAPPSRRDAGLAAPGAQRSAGEPGPRCGTRRRWRRIASPSRCRCWNGPRVPASGLSRGESTAPTGSADGEPEAARAAGAGRRPTAGTEAGEAGGWHGP